ncbi:hypothetical protein Hypma_010295 [Hypsizygus marmoreus]|uniref:Uncharacterized protein n=1 Tax=Hypsizygus marmoreus TaxID=39966 RepID=A0A369JN91_HYPMA|nr:hypothetical protein Hypma_010295 [Hypsizygus marmoreus]
MQNGLSEPSLAIDVCQGPVRHNLSLSPNAYVFKSSRYSPARNADSPPWVRKRPHLSLRQLDQHGAGAVNLAASAFALPGFVPLSSLSTSYIQVANQHEALESGITPCTAFLSAPYAPSLDMISESPASCIAVYDPSLTAMQPTDATRPQPFPELTPKPFTPLAVYRADSTIAFADSEHLLSLTEVFPGMGIPPCPWCSTKDTSFMERPAKGAIDYGAGVDYPFLLPDPLIPIPDIGISPEGDLAVLGSVVIY